MCDDEQNKDYFVNSEVKGLNEPEPMTYEEALDKLLDNCDENCQGYKNSAECDYCQNAMSIMALEKQIPKKPNIRYFDHFVRSSCAYCPTCGEPFGELYPQKGLLIRMMLAEKQAHCIGCGQAIDFTEVEE